MPAGSVSMMVRIVRYRSDGSTYAHENGSGIARSADVMADAPGTHTACRRVYGPDSGPGPPDTHSPS